MDTKGVTCKIPLELHNRISEEIRASGSTMSRFIEMVITSYYEEKEKGDQVMGKTRTMAFQISEELFQKIKEYLAEFERVYHRRLTQKEFVVGLIEQALEEAEEEFAAVRAALGEDNQDNDEEAGADEDTEDEAGDVDEAEDAPDGADPDEVANEDEDEPADSEGTDEDEAEPDETEDANEDEDDSDGSEDGPAE